MRLLIEQFDLKNRSHDHIKSRLYTYLFLFMGIFLSAFLLYHSDSRAEEEGLFTDYGYEVENNVEYDCMYGPDYGMQLTMEVVNCQEWVSLREMPDVNSRRLAVVPLGALFFDCYWYSDEFVFGEYNGQYGYILADYLTFYSAEPYGEGYEVWDDYGAYFDEVILSYDEMAGFGSEILNEPLDDCRIIAVRSYENGESLYVGCYTYEDEFLWGYITGTEYKTELDATDTFIAGTEEDPRVAIFNVGLGLYMVESITGDIIWELAPTEASFSGSICQAVDQKGTMYVAGYYDTDITAVSIDGEVLWQANADNDDVYWPYEINVYNDEIVVDYESGTENGHFVVAYNLDGRPEWMDVF